MMRSAFAALRFVELVCPTLLGARSLDTTTWVSSTYYCDKCYFWDTSVGHNTDAKIELLRNAVLVFLCLLTPMIHMRKTVLQMRRRQMGRL